MVDRLEGCCRGALVAFTCLTLAGCSALPKRSFVSPIDPDTLDDATFVHYLASVPTVTMAEGTRGVLLLRGPTEQWSTYEARRDELVRVGAMKIEWALQGDDTLDMGTLAYMLRSLCDLSPSVSERIAAVTGLGDRRYALRRCVDESILPYSDSARPVRGGEFVAALGKSEILVQPPAKDSARQEP